MNKSKIKNSILEYFTFSKSERNGIIVLIILIISMAAIPALLPSFFPENNKIDVTKFENEIIRFEKNCDSFKNNTKLAIIRKDTSGQKKYTKPSKKETASIIEINAADTLSLDKLPGIGLILSRRIIKYREHLGGFISLNQLNEVYGLNPEIIQKIKKYLFVDTTIIHKIDINNAVFKEINSHPYISFEQTKAIAKYRTNKKIIDLAQLEEIGVFTKEEIKKIRPYLLLSQ